MDKTKTTLKELWQGGGGWDATPSELMNLNPVGILGRKHDAKVVANCDHLPKFKVTNCDHNIAWGKRETVGKVERGLQWRAQELFSG
jgi:hypothetical protein